MADRRAGDYTAFCGCGGTLRVPAAERDTMPRCPRCGKRMSVESVPSRVRALSPPRPPEQEPPLRTKIRPEADRFECVCGECVLIRGEKRGRRIQCLACERFHVLEIEAPPPVPEEPPRPAPALSQALGPGQFLCECGAVQPPRTSRTGRGFTCRQCGRAGHVEMVKDGLRAVITSGPQSPEAPRPTETVWTCLCGQAIDARPVIAGKEVSCPGCGRLVEVEKHHPRAGMTTIGPRFREPEGVAPPGTAPCACGMILQVAYEHVGRAVRCPSCGARMTVEVRNGKLALRPLG